MSLREEIVTEYIKEKGYGLVVPNVFMEFAINKVLDAAAEAVEGTDRQNSNYPALIKRMDVLESINKLRVL